MLIPLADSHHYLFYGDNLGILHDRLPDQSVDLCYIDPPFNSKRTYFQIYNNIGRDDTAQAQAFVDTWVWGPEADQGQQEILANAQGRFTAQTVDLIHGLYPVLKPSGLMAYLVHMTLRITEIHRVLKPTGSFYLHCDPTASHYLKLICDAVFVSQGGEFQNEIAWQRTFAHNDKRLRRFGRNHDVILFYTKSRNFVWNRLTRPHSPQRLAQYQAGKVTDNLTAPDHGQVSQTLRYAWKGIMPPNGRTWLYPRTTMDELDRAGRIVYTRHGKPRLKMTLADSPGVPVQDTWTDISAISSAAKERLGYPTQKPEALLERIIKASTNAGDTVLDAYCGCGTTVAVAHRLGRRWIGMDISYQAVSLILKRLEDSTPAHQRAALHDQVIIHGIPRDLAAAQALAHDPRDKTRKEFEKWAILTYSHNSAQIHQKKGADGGVDGLAYFMVGADTHAKILFQVKSGHVNRQTVATLRGDMAREGAELGVLITLQEPTRPMLAEAAATGTYTHPLYSRRQEPRIRLVTVRDIVEHQARLDLPTTQKVLKEAQVANQRIEDQQIRWE